MQYLRFGTTTYKPLGPFLDSVSGTSLVSSATSSLADDAMIVKHNSTAGTTMQTLTAWSSVVGAYELYPFTTGETDTVGPLTVIINDADLILPLRNEFYVLSQPVYDGMFGSSGSTVLAPVNTAQINAAETTGIGVSTDKWRG